jgi:MoxR-like ATPase
MTNSVNPSRVLRDAVAQASQGLVERESLVELVALAAVAGEHLLVVGPPGTAKSEAVRRVAQVLGARYFEYLLGRFTEPSEIFGPVDLRKLREGVVETETAGMLPEAELAFLDEVFLGSTAILNTLLGVLNERVFRRGHTLMKCPLRLCVGATNALPDDETLAAFSDRFLVRIFVEPIADPRLEELLEGGWSLSSRPQPTPLGSTALLDELAQSARSMDMGAVRAPLAHAVRRLRAAGVSLTDRRAVKVQRLVAAAAVLAGRDKPTEADLWPLVFAVPTAEGQRVAREQLRELLARSENEALAAAAAEASQGPLARATRIAAAGSELLAQKPEGDPVAIEAWRLKLEGVAREIDAGFTSEALPSSLKDLRAQIVAITQASAGADSNGAVTQPTS